MLAPLTPSAVSTYSVPSSEPDKPAPSPYSPPSGLEPGVLSTRTHALSENNDVKFSREIVWDTTNPKKEPTIKSNRLVVETFNKADTVHVRNWPGDKLQITVNGRSSLFDAKGQNNTQQGLLIKTNGGNDKVIVEDSVKNRLDIEGGDGDDYLQAGGGRSRVYGQGGNDFIQLGSGLGYAEGNDGDDTIKNGKGNAVIYGNNGNDRLYARPGAASKQTYMDGGNGNDVLFAGSGHTVLHGGNGDDQLVGADRTTFYTGKGNDRIWNNQPQDRIYAGANDHFQRNQGSTFTEVKPSAVGKEAYKVLFPAQSTSQQDTDFDQRVNDDIEFLRSSPVGQQALREMDKLAALNNAPIHIRPAQSSGSSYEFGSRELNNMTDEEFANTKGSNFGEITQGVPGSRADLASIYYDKVSVLENAERTNTAVPVTALFHEMSHAYNGATGTFVAGRSTEYPKPGESHEIENQEYQAIGIPNGGQAFDFDNNPSTPPTNTNPKPFNENALSEEMGKPLRQLYKFSKSDQGDGN